MSVSALHGDHVSSVAAFYPPTNFTIPRHQKKPPPEKHAHALPARVTKFFDEAYVIPGIDRGDPLISPLKASPDSFPRHVFISCATGDTLWNDGKELIDKLNSAGHPHAEFLSIPAEGHGFDKVAKEGSERRKKTTQAYNASFDALEKSWTDPIRGKAARNGAHL